MNIKPTPLNYQIPTRVHDKDFGCTFCYSHTGSTKDGDYFFCKWSQEIQKAYECKTVVAIYTIDNGESK
jgi:hypothetical protein